MEIYCCRLQRLLLSFTALANAQVTFDTLPITEEAFIPAGYGGLQWDNFGYFSPSIYSYTTGYSVDLMSKPNVAFNWSGDPASISIGSGSFKPVMAFVTAAWDNGLKLQIKGYLKGKLVLTGFIHSAR